MTFLIWLLDRLKEPSTWAGFGIAGLVGIGLAPETWDAIFAALAAVAAAAAAVIREKSR